MFEVQDLKYATLATVSRCGMVWFSEDVLSTDMIFNNFLARLRSIPLDEGEDEAQRRRKGKEDEGEEAASPMLQVGGHGSWGSWIRQLQGSPSVTAATVQMCMGKHRELQLVSPHTDERRPFSSRGGNHVCQERRLHSY